MTETLTHRGPYDEGYWFAEPTRLRILAILSSGEQTVNSLVKAVGLAQPTVSRHLSVLRESGFVVDRREGQQVVYSLNKEAIESCCQGFCACLAIPTPVSGGE